jgi:hypothetical protein
MKTRRKVTLYPERTVETFEAGTFRVNLRRGLHYGHEQPSWRIDIWDGWKLFDDTYLSTDQEAALSRFECSKRTVAVEIAARAFGLH